MNLSVKQMLESANATVERISPQQAQELIDAGDVLIVDVRDASEVQKAGKIKGAINVSRGMLEFRADPQSPYYDPAFRQDRTTLLYCASGGRSALSAKTLQEMGYRSVYNLGAFNDWKEAGFATESA
jgi:rhodanese-related sulfurtransferase